LLLIFFFFFSFFFFIYLFYYYIYLILFFLLVQFKYSSPTSTCCVFHIHNLYQTVLQFLYNKTPVVVFFSIKHKHCFVVNNPQTSHFYLRMKSSSLLKEKHRQQLCSIYIKNKSCVKINFLFNFYVYMIRFIQFESFPFVFVIRFLL